MRTVLLFVALAICGCPTPDPVTQHDASTWTQAPVPAGFDAGSGGK